MRLLPFLAALPLLVFIACSKAPEAVPAVAPAPPTPPPVVVGSPLSGPHPLKRPGANLVFVSFDALQAAHVGCYGHPRDTTPTLDALAKTGFRFANTYSVASWTVPASMTWFTGVYPSEHRLVNKFALYKPPVEKVSTLTEQAPTLTTLAQVMKANGYATGGFTGNAGVGGGFGFGLGFDEYYSEVGRFGGLDESVPRAVAWVRKHKEKPFFLFLHGYDVHGQRSPPGGFDFRYVEKEYDRKFTGSPQEQEVLREEGLATGAAKVRPTDVRFWRAIYDEKLRRADAQFAEFLAAFRAMGLMEKTVFVVTADHGTELHEHGRFDHGFTLYDELLRVPLIVSVPNTTGRVIPDRVSSIDVTPTLLDLIGAKVPDAVKKQLRGKSLLPALAGEPVTRPLFSETDYREYTYKRAVITPDGWKLIYTLETQGRELFDLNTDPGETKNLAATDGKRADALREQLFAHFAAIGHDLRARRWELGLNPVYPSQGKPKR